MEEVSGKYLDEERALYGRKQIKVSDCKFDGPADGESALKECQNLVVENCYFNLRYPFWHVTEAVISGCEMTDKCRAALWYDNNITLENCRLNGIKALRECEAVALTGCRAQSPEFAWRCRNVQVKHSTLESEYPFFECQGLEIEDLNMKGKYSFQYTKNSVIRDSHLDTKDAFWHSENVTVEDSVIRGEYLGWYSRNLKLVRCRIIGTQPLCYCSGLVLEDCTMEETDLAFERSEVQAVVHGGIVSVKNPSGGSITADEIGELIMEPEYTVPEAVRIVTMKPKAE